MEPNARPHVHAERETSNLSTPALSCAITTYQQVVICCAKISCFFCRQNIQNSRRPTVFFVVKFFPQVSQKLGGSCGRGPTMSSYYLVGCVLCTLCTGPNKYSVEWTPLCLIESSYLCSYKSAVTEEQCSDDNIMNVVLVLISCTGNLEMRLF